MLGQGIEVQATGAPGVCVVLAAAAASAARVVARFSDLATVGVDVPKENAVLPGPWMPLAS